MVIDPHPVAYIYIRGWWLDYLACCSLALPHYKTTFVQTHLLAVGIDANGKNVLLAWAVVESENTNSWDYFLHHLKAATPEVEAATFMSDRSKGPGLLRAGPTLGPEIVREYCYKHLKANFIKHAGKQFEPFFWTVANAKTREEYNNALRLFELQNLRGATYLQAIDPTVWVDGLFVGQNFGHKPSKIV